MVILSSLLHEQSWQALLMPEFDKPYMKHLEGFLSEALLAGKTILPPQAQWFEALNATPLQDVKVVIVGQDPYPTPGHAHGLCFSALPEVTPLPKSLNNIYRELQEDCGVDRSDTGCLLSWAQQGVLLLNTVLTVEAGKTGSHSKQGWELFTDAVIEAINTHGEHCVFMLWGAQAQNKGRHIDRSRHLVLSSPHPSPLSAYRGFWGSRPFSRTNRYLLESGREPIVWESQD